MSLRPKLGARRRAIPLADTAELRAQAGRTLAVRVLLGALAAAALVGAVLVSRDARGEQTQLFAGHGSGVLVVDLSASVGATPHARIGRAFRQLVASRSSFGLVFFSDVAYEALPPGTRWTELRPLLRFFTRRPRPASVGGRPRRFERPAPSPWTGLRGGTRISTGLALARQILRRDGARDAGVLLVSDLDDSLFDTSALTRTLSDYEREDIPLRVLGLSPSRDDQEFFERIIGKQAIVSSTELAPSREGREANVVKASDAFPAALVAAALVLLLAVAANEHWSTRLRWRGEST